MPADAVAGSTATRTARNVLALAVAEMAGKLGTFVLLLAAARILGRDDFGSFAFALSFGLLVASLPSWGFDTELVARGSREPDRVGTLLTSVLAVRTLVAVPVVLVAGVLGALTRPAGPDRLALVLVLLASVVDVYGDAGRAAAGALQDQRGVARALVVQRGLACVLAVGAMVGGLGLVGLSAAYLAGTVGGAVGVLLAVRRLGVRLDRAGLAREARRALSRASHVFGANNVVNMALFRLDAVLLGVLVTDVAVGTYSAAYRLLETVLFLSFAVARSVFPVLSAEATPERVRYGVQQSVAVVALAYVPFAAVLLLRPTELLDLLYGGEYAESGTPVLRLLALAPLLYGVAFLAAHALIALGRGRRLLTVTLLAVAGNAAGNLVLIPREQEVGAALVTVLTFLFQAVLLLALVMKEVGVVRLDRALVVPAIAVLAVVALLLAPLPLPVALALSGLAFGGQVLLLGPRLAPDQTRVLRALVRR